MRDVDKLIDEALDAEEREMLAQHRRGAGLLRQAFGLFSGRLGWMNIGF